MFVLCVGVFMSIFHFASVNEVREYKYVSICSCTLCSLYFFFKRWYWHVHNRLQLTFEPLPLCTGEEVARVLCTFKNITSLDLTGVVKVS